jgi:hypothetical protein
MFMKEKTLRELRDAAPFAPFQINFSDGKAVTVVSPDHLFFIPKRSEFMVVKADGGFRIVDLNQVVSIGRDAKSKVHTKH